MHLLHMHPLVGKKHIMSTVNRNSESILQIACKRLTTERAIPMLYIVEASNEVY